MRPRSRDAFTLFELLVIMAILAILFSLLLPALLKVRRAADRVRSVNNLRQLALACHNYSDANASFPPGNDDNNFSASARLLPYLEQSALYNTLDMKKPSTDKANAMVRQVRVPVFLSPNDPLMTVTENSGATNYLFNAGSKPGLVDNNGVFYQNSKIKFPDITDGTSNTLMIGETLKGDGSSKGIDVRRQHVQLDKSALKEIKEDAGVQDFKASMHIAGDRCASWIDGRFMQGTLTGTLAVNDERPDVNCGGAGGLSALRSLEDQAVNVALCDGSVRTVTKKVGLEAWKLLFSRNDGMPIPDF
jgi:type II secretory pathway pseudopilin PulG